MSRLCDCGKHRCGRPSLPTVGIPLAKNSEYSDRYLIHAPQYQGKQKPPVHSVASNEPCSSVTESREKFTPKPIPPRVPPPKREYHPTPGKLESKTGYTEDFQPWRVDKRQPIKNKEENRITGPFSGNTTNKEDFQAWPISLRYMHPKPVYHPNPHPLESSSSYTKDYLVFPVNPPPQRPPEVWHPLKEDRDFSSTMQSTYLGCVGPRPSYHAPPVYVPNVSKFEGTSTSHDDYTYKVCVPTPSCQPIPVLPEKLPFSGTSEYTSIYLAPKVHQRPQRRTVVYVPPSSQGGPAASFEPGQSTMKSDFKATVPPPPRCPDFSPKLVYQRTHDDRSFLTQTKSQHGSKQMPLCVAVKRQQELGSQLKWVHKPDGHIYLESKLDEAHLVK
ncbi:hypothetical protein HMI55_002822 [Coelomomyces lativittatus]|nr:hypothetical protein HMI55_002822 [Coelomomyces lativittatus]